MLQIQALNSRSSPRMHPSSKHYSLLAQLLMGLRFQDQKTSLVRTETCRHQSYPWEYTFVQAQASDGKANPDCQPMLQAEVLNSRHPWGYTHIKFSLYDTHVFHTIKNLDWRKAEFTHSNWGHYTSFWAQTPNKKTSDNISEILAG